MLYTLSIPSCLCELTQLLRTGLTPAIFCFIAPPCPLSEVGRGRGSTSPTDRPSPEDTYMAMLPIRAFIGAGVHPTRHNRGASVTLTPSATGIEVRYLRTSF